MYTLSDATITEQDAHCAYSEKYKMLKVELPNDMNVVILNPRDRMKVFPEYADFTSTDVYKEYYHVDDYTLARDCCGYDVNEFDAIMRVKQKIKYLGVQYVKLSTVPFDLRTVYKLSGHECGKIMNTGKWAVKDEDRNCILIFTEKPDKKMLANAYAVTDREDKAFTRAHTHTKHKE